jgi:SAM-dependent methyltransferase
MLRDALGVPSVYDLFSSLIGENSRMRPSFVKEHVCLRPGQRVLDIGCGTGAILDFLPQVEYVGIDHNPSYIEAATRNYANRAKFLCQDILSGFDSALGQFDVVLLNSVLHHLGDGEVTKVLNSAKQAMSSNARLLSLDGCYEEEQSFLSRWLLNLDRGAHVRTRAEYLSLVSPIFSEVRDSIRRDLLRIPYTLLILECRR